MPKITAIRVSVKRHNRRSLFVDGKFFCSIPEVIFFEWGLQEGAELSNIEIADLLGESKFQQAKQLALNLLSFRLRSIKEVNDRLIGKGFSHEITRRVTTELEDKGYLNDEEFAIMFAREKVKSKYLGSVALKNELYKKGISQDIIKSTTRAIYEEFSSEELVRNILKKRGVNIEDMVEVKEKKRILNQLRLKGFSWDEIEPLVRELKVRSTDSR